MTIFKRKYGFKQFLVLLLILTLICPGALSAQKKKHGTTITVIKKDGYIANGELLKVNDAEILLMSCSESGNTIPISEIKMIEIEKKGKFLTGAAIGFGISIIGGGILYASLGDRDENPFLMGAIAGAISGAPISILTGLIASNTARHKTYNFENASQHQVFLNLLKLKTLARF